MLLRMLYDDHLAQAAWLIGCQKTGEALVIDPERDVDRCIDAAKKEGLRIVAVAETHIHADFLSGSRELAERLNAHVYVSDEGDADWKYQWLDKRVGGGSYEHTLLRHNDVFTVGGVELRALHTPGHTPEHLSFLVTDRGAGATEPMGLATGDFVFVGDVGRPDLLESAAGVVGAKDPAARALFRSVAAFRDLPDYLQVWPAHGAGSACGKALGAVPQSTVGYEKRFNPALRTVGERDFVDFILAGQPEPPMYFARMKRQNKEGPRVLGRLPAPRPLTDADLRALDTSTTAVIDTRAWKAVRAAPIPGALYAPLDTMFPMVVGSYIAEDEPIVILCEPARLDEIVRDLVRIGLDRVEGWATHAAADAAGKALAAAPIPEIDAHAARRMLDQEAPFLLDVRRADEFAAGHIPHAVNIAYTRLPERLRELPADRPILVNCRSGGRSARAAAYLRRRGFRVTNLAGGFSDWELARLPVETTPAAAPAR